MTRPSLKAHWKWLTSAALLLVAAQAANAHSEDITGGGFVRGFLHPLTGGDHLLAMVAVGMWGAVLEAPLIWVLPVTFPMLMVFGAVAALAGIALPSIEPGIALSVLVLGLAIAACWRAAIPVAIGIVAFFGFLHGYAHGRELPQAASAAAYASGFVLASGMLHGVGIAIGTVRMLPFGTALLRVMGGLIAGAGVWLLSGRAF